MRETGIPDDDRYRLRRLAALDAHGAALPNDDRAGADVPWRSGAPTILAGAPKRMSDTYLLYGVPVSFFTAKIRCYLRKKAIPFQERLPAHPDFFGRAMSTVGRFVVPVLETPDGVIVQDTKEMVDLLEARFPERPQLPQGACQSIVGLILELFIDEGHVKTALHYRWNFPDQNDEFLSRQLGRFIAPTADNDTARALAARTTTTIRGVLERSGVHAVAINPIEESTLDLIDAMDVHLRHLPYFLGGRPTVADYAFAGLFVAHMGRDPAPSILIKSRAERVWRWIERIQSHDPDMPEFWDMPEEVLAHDAIPDTLRVILQLVARDFLPEAMSTIAAVDAWLAAHPQIKQGDLVVEDGGTRVKSIGMHAPMLRGVAVNMEVRHYMLWMIQSVRDRFLALNEADRKRVSNLLQDVGLIDLVMIKARRRIERKNYREYWGAAQDA